MTKNHFSETIYKYMITMKNTKAQIIEAYNNLLEVELQRERIDNWLNKNGLKIEDLKVMLSMALNENKEIE